MADRYSADPGSRIRIAVSHGVHEEEEILKAALFAAMATLNSLQYRYFIADDGSCYMRNNCVKKGILAIALLFGVSAALPVYGQVGQDLKNAGKDTKDATVSGAKKTGKGTKKAAKKTGHEVKKGTHKAADKVADKTDTSK
jgi:hypothetical protein